MLSVLYLKLDYLPKSIAITGSGIIAIEFAKIFRNLGADVTLIIRDQVPRNALMKIGLDKDVAATLVADLVVRFCLSYLFCAKLFILNLLEYFSHILLVRKL